MKAVDYRITDSLADPPGTTEAYHAEHLVRLNRCFLAYVPPPVAPPVAPRPAPRGPVTFGSFNNLAKLSPQTLALWAEVLGAVPGSRLLLKARALSDEATRRRVTDRFRAAGVRPERLELLGWVASPAGHLGAYDRVDIALDSYPYHGTMTTCEALWMGVPVITLAGRTHVSRVGVSLLSSAGLGEWVARSPTQYVQLAASLAANSRTLAELRISLRARVQQSPLVDTHRLSRELERVFRQVYDWWRAGHQPF